MQRMVSDLPAPLAPSTPTNSPFRTVKLMPFSRALPSGRRFVRFVTVSIGKEESGLEQVQVLHVARHRAQAVEHLVSGGNVDGVGRAARFWPHPPQLRIALGYV